MSMLESKRGGYVVVGTRGKPNSSHPHSHVWRIWAANTSFYVKPRDKELGSIKISLHGPDDRPGVGNPGFKFGFDSSVSSRRGVLYAEGFENRWYPGEQVSPSAKRALRIRIGWDTLRPGDPAGRGKLSLPKTMAGAIVKAPAIGYAVDLDLFVSDNGQPYWPVPFEQIRRDAAFVGPFRNDAGQVLSVVSTHRSMFRNPTPEQALEIPPMSTTDSIRGIYLGAPPDSHYLWAVETFTSRQAFLDQSQYSRPSQVSIAPMNGDHTIAGVHAKKE